MAHTTAGDAADAASPDSPNGYVTRLLDGDCWDDFAELVEANNGVWGGCWCLGFHLEGVGNGATREGNREAKLAYRVRLHGQSSPRSGSRTGGSQRGAGRRTLAALTPLTDCPA